MFRQLVSRTTTTTLSHAKRLTLVQNAKRTFASQHSQKQPLQQNRQVSRHFSRSNIIKNAFKYTTAPIALGSWSFSNSPTFDKDLEESMQKQSEENTPPPPPIIFSGSEGLITESFSSWIRALLAQVGHFDPETAQSDLATFSPFHEDIEDEIDRVHLEPETFVWCKNNLNEIFRFSNHEGMSETYEISVPVPDKLEDWPTYQSNQVLFNELIKFKTFIEKERYKYFRRYEELMEHSAEMGQSLDMMNVALAQANPYDEKMERYVSNNLAPIYKSVYESLLSIVDVSSIIDKPLLHAQLVDEQVQKLFDEKLEANTLELFPKDRSTWTEQNHLDYRKLENAVFSRALHMLRGQALALNQANNVAGSLQQLYHELSWDFKTYYDPNTYEKIINYALKEAELSGDEREAYFAEASRLPVPPLFDLRAAGILNLYVDRPNLVELANQLALARDENDPTEIDTSRIDVVSGPAELLFRLVNDKKENIIPSIHHRSIVYHQFDDIVQKVRQRPYIIYGLQKRMLDTISHPKDQQIHDLRNTYVHSAKEQRKKKRDKKMRTKKRSKKSSKNGFEDMKSHTFHPDHDDFHALRHHELENVENILHNAVSPATL